MRAFNIRAYTLICVAGLLLAACGEEAGVVGEVDVTAVDTVGDANVATDTAVSDTAVTDAQEEDAGASVCEPGTGCFEELCDSAEDCLSGICTMHLGDKVCSKTCDATCPEGWSCTLVGSGGDGQYVCMSDEPSIQWFFVLTIGQ